MKDVIFMRPDEVRQKRGSVYLLESDALFKIGSSAEPLTRVRAQKHLFHEDATTESVQRVWIAPLIERYDRMERVFQYHVSGYGLGGQESNRETWLKGCGWSRELDANVFSVVPDDCLVGYFRLLRCFAGLVSFEPRSTAQWQRYWETILDARKLRAAEWPLPEPATKNEERSTSNGVSS